MIGGPGPERRLSVAQALVASLLEADLTALCDAAMSEQLVGAMRLDERVQALTLVTAGAWEPRQVWCGTNARSARSWLARHGEVTTPAAGRVLRGGRLVHTHSVVGAALVEGKLTAAKVSMSPTPPWPAAPPTGSTPPQCAT